MNERSSFELKRRVVAEAIAAGAGAVRVVAAECDERTRGRMRAAFARGDFATWRYGQERALAVTSPERLLPGARSIVCVALAYGGEAPSPRGRAPLAGRVSTYAWGTDYHAVLRALLRRVAEVLDEAADAPATRIVCDTAPLAERAYAARAGLGWVGKHTNLIVPGLGSYVFLGQIVTTLELEPDAPLRKSCGACARCVSVCPTGALRGDYTIDAVRCIADLTQRTDAIPLALRPLLGEWIWGCDLCQEICPPTRQARSVPLVRLGADARGDATIDLIELLEMRGARFKRRFGATAMGWRGAAVLRRNAAVALGNALDRVGVPALERALCKDSHAMVRGHAAWALGRIASPRALAALRCRLFEETDSEARGEIVSALEPFPEPTFSERRP